MFNRWYKKDVFISTWECLCDGGYPGFGKLLRAVERKMKQPSWCVSCGVATCVWLVSWPPASRLAAGLTPLQMLWYLARGRESLTFGENAASWIYRKDEYVEKLRPTGKNL
ncbi:hypothetical protein C0J52_09433 [Blattella germanica]|nr:hypothetical protein C0J52_09433 [Blattella germanica]